MKTRLLTIFMCLTATVLFAVELPSYNLETDKITTMFVTKGDCIDILEYKPETGTVIVVLQTVPVNDILQTNGKYFLKLITYSKALNEIPKENIKIILRHPNDKATIPMQAASLKDLFMVR